MIMKTQEWDTSLDAMIPNTILLGLGIGENDKVEIQSQGNVIFIRNALTDLDMLFEDYNGNFRCNEIDFGEDMGKELIEHGHIAYNAQLVKNAY